MQHVDSVMTCDISVILATERFVVVDKPSGMLAVPGRGPDKQDCVIARVRRRYPHATGPMVVHRLDMETSGLMLVGLDAAAQRHLSMQFERGHVWKTYAALVDGRVEGNQGTIDLAIRPDINRRPIQIVDPERGKAAVTEWQVVSRETDRTRLRLVPQTGRTHQLRVHLASGLGHAIIGDTLYGEGGARLMLHACELSFLDPEGGRRRSVESAVPF